MGYSQSLPYTLYTHYTLTITKITIWWGCLMCNVCIVWQKRTPWSDQVLCRWPHKKKKYNLFLFTGYLPYVSLVQVQTVIVLVCPSPYFYIFIPFIILYVCLIHNMCVQVHLWSRSYKAIFSIFTHQLPECVNFISWMNVGVKY